MEHKIQTFKNQITDLESAIDFKDKEIIAVQERLGQTEGSLERYIEQVETIE